MIKSDTLFIVLLLGTVAAALYYMAPNPVIVEKTSTSEMADRSITTTTATRKFNKKGVLRQEVVAQSEQKNVVRETRVEQKVLQASANVVRPNYSLRAGIVTDLSDLRKPRDYYIGVGKNLFLNVSAEAEYRVRSGDISVGLRIDL